MKLSPNSKCPFPVMLDCLTHCWDTSGGQSLRALLWSLFNGLVNVPLWEAWTALDEHLQSEFTRLMLMGMDLRAAAIEKLLRESSEWDRIDTVPLRWSSKTD